MEKLAKKSIASNVALNKLIHWMVRLAFLRMGLELTRNQLTGDAWLLRSSPSFNVRKLMKNITHTLKIFGLKYLAHLESLGEKNALCIYVFLILC